MRPHADKPLSKTRSSLRARARLRQAVGWLRGHPLGSASDETIPWLSVPEPGTGQLPVRLEVHRQQLRQTTFRKNLLQRDFPRVLPELVGELSAWNAGIDARLAPLKASVHHATALPSRREQIERLCQGRRAGTLSDTATAIEHQFPKLGAAVDAVCWRARDRRQAQRLLAVIRDHGVALQGLLELTGAMSDLAMAIELLATDGDRAVILLEILANPEHDLILDAEAMRGLARASAVLENRFALQSFHEPWPRVPTADGELRRSMRGLLDLIYVSKAPVRRRMFEFLAIAWPTDLGVRWGRYLRKLARAIEWAELWLQTVYPSGPDQAKRNEYQRLLRGMTRIETHPPPRRPSNTQEALATWLRTTGEEPKLANLARRTLAALPCYHKDIATRLRMACLWHRLAVSEVQPMSWLGELLQRSRQYLQPSGRAQADSPHLLLPWRHALDDGEALWRCLPFEACDAEPLAPPAETWRALAALRDVTEYPVDDASLELLETLLEATHCAAHAMQVLHTIHRAGRAKEFAALEDDLLITLCKLTAAAPERILELADQFDGESLDWRDAHALEALVGTDHSQYFVEALIAGERPRLIVLGRQLQMAGGKQRDANRQLTLAWPKTNARPSWRRYPEALHPALIVLASATEDAAGIAAEILRRDFPDPEQLRAEIRGLRSRLASAAPAKAAGMRQRLASRQRVLASLHQTQLSPRRLAKYTDKLQQRARRITLDHLTVSVRSAIVRQLTGKLSATCLQWCEQHPVAQRILPSLSNLPKRIRDVALRLLAARTGEPPWDLREAEGNRAFLRRAARQGVVMAAFLDDAAETVTGLNGQEIQLALEADPLEVMLMGERFNTCLSLGRENFFSTIGNAADVNKRVLYARDERGEVIGRCLLALDQAGRLLRFHAYCHLPDLGFETIIDLYCQRLAKTMHTTRAEAGVIASLVSPDWYDDGACDIVGREPWLQDGSRFLGSLAEIDAADLHATIATHTDNHPDPTTLLRILTAIEQAGRPDLVTALRAWILIQDDIAMQTKAARLAQLGKRDDLAEEFLHQLPRSRRAFVTLDHHQLEDLIEALVDLQPHRALQVLRWTRDTRVRRWADETSYPRILSAARAHERLHRRRLALQLYQKLTGMQSADESVNQRVRVLQKVLGP